MRGKRPLQRRHRSDCAIRQTGFPAPCTCRKPKREKHRRPLRYVLESEVEDFMDEMERERDKFAFKLSSAEHKIDRLEKRIRELEHGKE